LRRALSDVNTTQAGVLAQAASSINARGAPRAGVEASKLSLRLGVRKAKVRGKGKYQSIGPKCRIQ
ncbi:unnamed protein product, partial [Prorocentrum cordatum]